jgi:peptide/nickel transport system substrate-binding protein
MRRINQVIIILMLATCTIWGGCASATSTGISTPSGSTQPKSTLTNSPSSSQPSKPTAAAPQSGGTLKIITAPGITNLGDPTKPRGSLDLAFNRPCLESLIDINSNGEFVPMLATGWQTSPDYKSITINLRKGVKFHDGTDFNAQATKDVLDLVRQSPLGTDLRQVTSVDIIDDSSIRLNLSTYEPAIINGLTVIRIASPTSMKSMGNDINLRPVGTGPFKFVSYQADVSLKFAKFVGYWQQGKPYLDGVEFSLVADPATAMAAFRNGEGHVLANVSASDGQKLKAAGGNIAITTAATGINGIAGDSKNPQSIFADIKVRQAIAYAIDDEAISSGIGHGLFLAANQFFPPKSPYYNSNVVGYPYNPAKAKQLLSEAGYPKGFQTKLTFPSGKERNDIMTAVQDYLKNVGIDATMDMCDIAKMTDIQKKGWTNGLVFYITNTGMEWDPAQAITRNFTNNPFQYPSVSIPADFENKLNAAVVERNYDSRKTQFREISKSIIDQYCMAVPIYVGCQITGFDSSKVHDLDKTTYIPHIWHPENAWLSK